MWFNYAKSTINEDIMINIIIMFWDISWSYSSQWYTQTMLSGVNRLNAQGAPTKIGNYP